MFLDAGELWAFYDRPIGHTVRRLLGTRIRSRWRHIDGETLIGLGYASPFMGSFRGEARRIGALMPAPQGAVVWPARGASMTALIDVEDLPLPDASVDRIIVAHCLEHAERTHPVLREIWRVLAPEGTALFIVPNRSGVWARVETTPFGQGRPFSRGQLERFLREAMLSPVSCSYALHMPPVERRLVLRSAVAFERVGASVWPGIGGVMLIEARKELNAPSGTARVTARTPRLVTIPGIRTAQPGRAARRPNARAKP